MTGVLRLRGFVRAMTRLAEAGAAERRFLAEDDRLPGDCAAPGPTCRQHLPHRGPLERFSLVSVVRGPGQRTPLHDNTVWGLVGMPRGAALSTETRPAAPMRPGRVDRLRPGAAARSIVQPATGAARRFVLGYTNTAAPDSWDRSAEQAVAA